MAAVREKGAAKLLSAPCYRVCDGLLHHAKPVGIDVDHSLGAQHLAEYLGRQYYQLLTSCPSISKKAIWPTCKKTMAGALETG
jgi:hypothetical protein